MKKITVLLFALLSSMILLAGEMADCIDTVRIGDFAFGGIVFWIDETGQHGLVCSKTDQISGIFWHDMVSHTDNQEENDKITNLENETSTNIRDKKSGQPENLATQVCFEYSVNEEGVLYKDWYLPSKEEVCNIYKNRDVIERSAIKNGGSLFTPNNELSPTEFCNSPSWDQVFNYGYQNYEYKKSKFNVRAVRAF